MPTAFVQRVTSLFGPNSTGTSAAKFDEATPLAKIGIDLGQGAGLLCDEIYLGLLALWKQRCWLKSE